MPVLYVTEQRSIVRKTSDRLIVEKDDKVLMDVDRFSARLLNLGILKEVDFTTTPEKGTVLGRDALKRYFVEYEKELNAAVQIGEESLSWRQLFRRQAERLARALVDDVPYEAFRLPC